MRASMQYTRYARRDVPFRSARKLHADSAGLRVVGARWARVRSLERERIIIAKKKFAEESFSTRNEVTTVQGSFEDRNQN